MRPMPHCTSSKIRMAPVSSQRWRSALRYSAPRSNAPPTPCTGSTTTAAVLSVICASAAASRRGRNFTSKGVRGKPYHFLAAPQVSAPAAAVRPWKLCSSATTSVRPGFSVNAIFSAFSLASAPLLMKNTLSTGRLRERDQLVRRARAHVHGHGIALEVHGARLLGERCVQAGWP